MRPDLKPALKPFDDSDPLERESAVLDASLTIDRYVRFLIRLSYEDSLDFFRFADQVQAEIRAVRACARRVEDSTVKDVVLDDLKRAASVVSFLRDYPPIVGGSSGLTSGTPSRKIGTVRPSGLPGLGKNRKH